MNSQSILREIALCWQKLAYYFGQFLVFVRRVIADPSIIPLRDLVVMCAIALILALFLVGGLIRFITEPWKKKLQNLLTLLIFLLVLAVAAFFALRGVPLPNA